MNHAIITVSSPSLKLLKSGKVRTIFEYSQTEFLIVATDRISAFDVVLPTGIPHKGVILTQLSNYWFERLESVMNHHIVTREVNETLLQESPELTGRSVVVKKLKILPFEFIIRGYISGSLWKSYSQNKSLPGVLLPDGLQNASQLPEPIFTPTTKASSGHDLPISETDLQNAIGRELAQFLKEKSIDLYLTAAREAREKGLIIADTKLEFGLDSNDAPVLADEIFTPDSSRFWPLDTYKPGKNPASFDKQYVRDYLETLDWSKTPPGPELPAPVVEATQQRYFEAFRRLTGRELSI